MPVVICFANMKGGVGKTTLCVNLAYELFSQRKRVLLVDNDPQFNATSALLRPEDYIRLLKSPGQHSIYHIYEKPPRLSGQRRPKIDPKTFFVRAWYMRATPDVRLDLIPSQIELYETLRNPSQKEYLLDRFLQSHARKYDYVLIDCPPTPSVLTLSAFAASDYVVIPVSPDYFATMGLPQFLGTLEDFKDSLVDAHGISPLGIVYTRVPRTASVDTTKAMQRVDAALKELEQSIPVFASRMSHFKVYEKTLWQSVPVQKVSGPGIRGKSLARAELRLIAQELQNGIHHPK